ncbi:MAG: hypothetical protein KAS72_15530 [Phycisphaerales bacterium]|nr:hypothetical protein [Phycisphaerales bacterium]
MAIRRSRATSGPLLTAIGLLVLVAVAAPSHAAPRKVLMENFTSLW